MNYLFNQFDIYHHLNFASLTTILYITQKILITSLIQNYKENDDQLDNNTLIHFELFISYPTLLILISTIANTTQLIFAFFLQQISGLSLLICFISSSIINGISIWWALVKLRRTSYRKSRLLWFLSQNLLLIIILLYQEFNISGLFAVGISFVLQLIGIFLGMAIGSLYIQDAYGEFKQQFLDNPQATSIKKQISFHIYYGLLPFLSLIRISQQIVFDRLFNNTFDLLYFALIQFFQTKIMTYNDESSLKSNWGIKSMKLSKSPMYYLLIYQCIISLNRIESFDFNNIKNIALCDFMIFVISNGAVGLSSILVQKYLQEQKK
ncbi:unnamed protein product [Paramecium sonneborni]|uniref:Transmembrane protein n=1 Tax=Paramecium sonneborni TaxID=65129 RepID=A0A8S1MBN3_9CILI|nr:unnamed protein product [Paramecium sonneborni]